MKTVRARLILLFIAIVTTACNGVPPTPTTPPTSTMDFMGTAISIVRTEAVMTQAAIPTETPIAPTSTPENALSNGQASPPSADQLVYAMAVAQNIYTLFPYINSTTPYGEYSGCTENYDFHNFVSYVVPLPIETVGTAFLTYFSTEKWEFTEAASEFPRTTYDVYRISSKVEPSFERLNVILTDESTLRGEDHIDVRAELTHVETKENFRYLVDPLTCYNKGARWLWIRLTK